MRHYPHELSDGMCQRLMIAMGLLCQPDLLTVDEPVSAPDVSIQAQIDNLLKDLRKKLQLSLTFIAHDLSVVRLVSDRVLVMYLGKVMEIADRESIYHEPRHPYTRPGAAFLLPRLAGVTIARCLLLGGNTRATASLPYCLRSALDVRWLSPVLWKLVKLTRGLGARAASGDPPQLLGTTWQEDDGGNSDATLELIVQDDDVMLVITHRRLKDRATMVNVASGWHAHLAILIDRSNKREPPGFWSVHAVAEKECKSGFAAD